MQIIEFAALPSPAIRQGEEALHPLLYERLACSHGMGSRVSRKHKGACRDRGSPTPQQATILARTCGSVRYVYNWALRLRTDASYEWQERVSYADTSAALTLLKQQPQTTWLNEVSSVPPQH